jgi:predicted adenylyl cyclase CyaB
MRNLELKAAYADLAHAEQIAVQSGAAPGGDLHQIDTYFHVAEGRLKLREINGAGGELIFYRRPEADATRFSEYYTAPVADCHAMGKVLELSLGVRKRVEKERRLYLYQGARIHLDIVVKLGTFIEFEVPVHPGEPTEDEAARRLMDKLMGAYGIRASDAIRASYSELLDGRD